MGLPTTTTSQTSDLKLQLQHHLQHHCSHHTQRSTREQDKPEAVEIMSSPHNRKQLQLQLQRRRHTTTTPTTTKTTTILSRQVMCLAVLGAILGTCLSLAPALTEARITFEKMTNRDYSGLTYYTIQNVSLFECLGWCKEESTCTSAVFSFVVNPFAALQETTCMLQNETQARQTAYLRSMPGGDQLTVVAHPQKATNLYFFNKIELQTEAVCSRLWAFERFPNRKLRQRDRNPFHAPNKESCQAACMNEQRFVCRSLEYNYISQQCTLNGYDRRSPLILHLANQASTSAMLGGGGGSGHHSMSSPSPSNNDLIEAPGTDYFENACLLGEDICNESRIYDYAKIGLPLHRVAHFVELNYYPDKEMLVKSQAGCVRACTIEHEFICRSILYRSSFKQGQPNCALYHLDQKTFPDGADTFMSHVMQPLLDSGETSAVYLEAVCNDTIIPTNLPIITSSTSASNNGGGSTSGTTMIMPSITIMPSSTTPDGLSVHQQQHSQQHNHSQMNEDRFISASTSTLSPINGNGNGNSGGPSSMVTSASSSTTIRLPTTSFLPPTSSSSSGGIMGPSGQIIPNNIQISDLPTSGGPNGRPMMPGHITIGPGGQQQQQQSSLMAQQRQPNNQPNIPGHLVISPAPPGMRDPQLIIDPNGGPDRQSLQISGSGSGATNHDQNCDAHGFCYDVALKCTDTKMVVNVKTQRPFFGRIYALGRSETCNANIKNQNQFQLDMYLTGQECNTQSASGTYTNTIVLQHHNVVLTKADKVYHVRCTYETASRNVSFGMMPVKDMFEVDVNDRNQETISITASSDAPLPKISILTLEGKEASTVRIGDRLTFRIEIPDNTPYGIFARSCIAMAKDARSTFEIIDEHGCPSDHTIFPNFLPVANGNALESNYEAFRFTESYGVIFQCNVKYCIGKCEPVNCGIGGRDTVEAWGRKKRSIGKGAGGQEPASGTGKPLGDDMTLSREIVVLDLKEKDPNAPAGFESDSDLTDGGSSGRSAQKSPLKSQNHQNHHHHHHSSSSLQTTSTEPDLASIESSSKHCLSSQSLFVLICSIGLFFVLYVCVVAYFFARRDPKISPIKHQFH